MILRYDLDHSGEIEFWEFAMLMGKKINDAEKDEELVDVNRWFDKD